MLARVPDGARRAGFGGLGSLVDAAGERLASTHSVSRLYLSRSGQYRIEPVSRSRRGDDQAQTVVCDGERRWRIGEREAWAGPAGPPFDFPSLFDASWLLAYQLAGGAEILTDGRSGHRLRGGPDYHPIGGWFLFPDEVVVDGELGILLRWISLAGERPVTWYELRDVAAGPVDPGRYAGYRGHQRRATSAGRLAAGAGQPAGQDSQLDRAPDGLVTREKLLAWRL
jgi:hypothetical protein